MALYTRLTTLIRAVPGSSSGKAANRVGKVTNRVGPNDGYKSCLPGCHVSQHDLSLVSANTRRSRRCRWCRGGGSMLSIAGIGIPRIRRATPDAAPAGPQMRPQPHQALKRLAQQLEAPRKTWSAAARHDPRNVPDLHAGSHARWAPSSCAPNVAAACRASLPVAGLRALAPPCAASPPLAAAPPPGAPSKAA